jgi:nucleotide-binding universal stress UspA family protein
MVTLERVLCAVEMRLEDINVLACACLMARPFRARVDTLLVRGGHEQPTLSNARTAPIQELDTTHEAEHLFAELLASTPGSRIAETLVGGEPRIILERSKACAADLIVLGLRRLSAFGPEQVVALADELSRRAPCPVLTVPPLTRAPAINRILLPVDFSPVTGRAVEWAGVLARHLSASVHVLHAVGSSALREAPSRRGESIGTSIERARGKLDGIERRLRAMAVECESSVVERGTTHAILAGRDRLESDLIVMGVHHPEGERFAERSTASGMVATVRCRAPVPVFSITTSESEDDFVGDDAVAGEVVPQDQAMSASGQLSTRKTSWEPSFT